MERACKLPTIVQLTKQQQGRPQRRTISWSNVLLRRVSNANSVVGSCGTPTRVIGLSKKPTNLVFRANQHSCGDENNNCQVVIQYMCDDNLKDGTTTDTPPVTCTDDCDTNEKFGHHESLNYYEDCNVRERNQGLFIADRVSY